MTTNKERRGKSYTLFGAGTKPIDEPVSTTKSMFDFTTAVARRA